MPDFDALVAAGHHLADREALRALAAEGVAERRERVLVELRERGDEDVWPARSPLAVHTVSAILPPSFSCFG